MERACTTGGPRNRSPENQNQATCSAPVALHFHLKFEGTGRRNSMHLSQLTARQTELPPDMACVKSFEHISDRTLRHVVAHWLDTRGERLMPALGDIDPTEIRSALAQIWLCDYLPESGRIRYRLAGDEINHFWGFNLSGKYLDEIVPAERQASVTSKIRMRSEEHTSELQSR